MTAESEMDDGVRELLERTDSVRRQVFARLPEGDRPEMDRLAREIRQAEPDIEVIPAHCIDSWFAHLFAWLDWRDAWEEANSHEIWANGPGLLRMLPILVLVPYSIFAGDEANGQGGAA